MIADEPLPDAQKSKGGKGFSLPPRALWTLGVVAFCGAVGEGAMADWGALYVHDDLGGSEGMAAFAFTVFSTTMLLGRFATDRVSSRFDPSRVVRAGAIVAVVGLIGGLLPSTTTAAIVGYAVMGLGLACVFPLVYSAAGSIPGVPSGRGVAAAATMGYTGFLAGPPLLGFVARVTSIQAALLLVAALIAVIPFYASSLKRREGPAVAPDARLPETA
jgi:fucose permease